VVKWWRSHSQETGKTRRGHGSHHSLLLPKLKKKKKTASPKKNFPFQSEWAAGGELLLLFSLTT
jgi:hypothetical protein